MAVSELGRGMRSSAVIAPSGGVVGSLITMILGIRRSFRWLGVPLGTAGEPIKASTAI